MEVNRKLNAFGAIIGAVGIFGFIISAILLMNSIQYLRGITDDGCVTIPAQTAFQFADTYYYLYRSEDANYLVEVPVTQEEYDGFVLEDTDPIERRVYEDANGTYYYFENLDAKPMAVLEEVGMPFKLPILILILAVCMAVGGFLWCFHGTPTKGKDLGELIQAKRASEEKEEKEESEEKEAE